MQLETIEKVHVVARFTGCWLVLMKSLIDNTYTVPNCNSDLRIAILLLNLKIYTSVCIVYTLAIKCYLLENWTPNANLLAEFTFQLKVKDLFVVYNIYIY